MGDGVCNFEIVDIDVDPNWQGKGLGRVVMEHVEGYLNLAVLESSFNLLVSLLFILTLLKQSPNE
ncbi:GNAT family N-acetyltransferase [Providencia rettgeri]|uniref:GNAT family N-acetyltransferase n=1 Tax=Providencia rettgeri TaxID=587 RepID=UPI001B394C11|nr:GNAT family N-acetyltransferase [Providencia rettgeri]MBQ0367268.1 GNAT family N-acetyltransferase [Providencia rettgeri]